MATTTKPSITVPTSTAVVLTFIALLGPFLGLADSWAVVILLPVLGVITFSLSHWLIDNADHAPPVID